MSRRSSKSRAAVLPGDPTVEYPFSLPYGLRPEGGVLKPDEERAEVVKRIFEDAKSGESIEHLVDVLRKENAPPPEEAREWTTPLVRQVLTNEAYAGRWGGIGRVEAIVSEDDFDAVQAQLGNP
jgi:hypothetical protein